MKKKRKKEFSMEISFFKSELFEDKRIHKRKKH